MKLLLLVQNESDVTHLDAAAKAILNSAIKGVWVVFSPAITVNASEAAKKLDGEIEQLRIAETQAATRTDYEAAKGYKVQREGKELDRQKALRDAWKTAPEEERKKKAREAFAPFIAQLQPNGINVKITGHSDHYEREQWVTLLNSLSGVWFKEFTLGSFVVGWPESVETSIGLLSLRKALAPTSIPPVVVTPTQEQKDAFNKDFNRAQRQKQLEDMHGLKRRNIAKGLGIDVEGKSAAELTELILAAEAGKKKSEEAVELAEY